MTRISLELDVELNKRLKQYALDRYGTTHAKQQLIIHTALISYLDAHEKKPQKIEVEPHNVAAYGMPSDGQSLAKEKPKTVKQKPLSQKRRQLINDLDAIAKLKTMWNAGDRNQAKLARDLGYPATSVRDAIARLQASGELSTS